MLALEVAKQTGAEIIGADAFQVYRGLDILTAKPPPSFRARVKHHLIDEVPLSASFDVGQYLHAAEDRIREISRRTRLILVVGGTGLYVRALTHGLADLPAADLELRKKLEAHPLSELERQLRELDPAGASLIDLKNRRRVIRALEICILTGHPFSSFRTEWSSPPTRPHGVRIEFERETLNARIDERTSAMFNEGVVEEVRATGEIGSSASQVIGLAEIRALLTGTMSRDQCMEAIRLSTRRYAKRQATWFRRESTFDQIQLQPGDDISSIARTLATRIAALAGGAGEVKSQNEK